MDEKLFSARMAEYKSAVDKYLDACLEETQCASYHKLTDSMHYSLTGGRQASARDLSARILPHLRGRRRKGAARGLRR